MPDWKYLTGSLVLGPGTGSQGPTMLVGLDRAGLQTRTGSLGDLVHKRTGSDLSSKELQAYLKYLDSCQTNIILIS